MTQALTETYPQPLREAIETLELALPAPGDKLEQDEEWVVTHVNGKWKKIRLHDYGDVYSVPGLYEKWVYDLFGCRSPQKVRDLLVRAMNEADTDPRDLTVLDLGAGNGYVAGVLRAAGAKTFVGIDIFEEAAEAAERDRPGLYDDYIIGDLTRLPVEKQSVLEGYDFNCLTCVAALGFGDIPPEVFAKAYNHVRDGGWVAFTIKTDFISSKDKSGFAGLIRRMVSRGVLNLVACEQFVHRVSTDGDNLEYEAFIGRKQCDIPDNWVPAEN